MQINVFGKGAAAIVATVALILMGALIGARVWTAAISDQRVAEREEDLVANGLKGWISEIAGRAVPQTTWDEAVRHLAVRYDRAWTQQNIGVYLREVGGFAQVYVLDARDRPLYAMSQGADRPPETYAAVAPMAGPLVADVRRVEASRRAHADDARPPSPNQSSAVTMLDGVPAILTATQVQPDFSRVRLAGPAPIVVTVHLLGPAFQAQFADRFLLQGLHVHPGDGPLAGRQEAGIKLFDRRGEVVARMEWTPQRPAHRLLRRSLPTVIVAMLIFAVVAAALFLRGRAAAQALMASESRAKHMAYHDHLTGLPNRAMLGEQLAHALRDAGAGGRALGILNLDLDRFKEVNDTYGHAAGDELITQVATRLKSLAEPEGAVARLGGDEFAILLRNSAVGAPETLAAQIIDSFATPFDLSFGRVYPSISIGVARIEEANVDSVEALRRADVAMYRAKDQGRACFQIYDGRMDAALQARHALENDLRDALDRNVLTMVYQPQVQGGRRVVGVEALVRWFHPERGAVSPAYFVSVAEECGLIDALGEFTLRRALADSRRWPGLRVAVNISAAQLRSHAFLGLIERVLADTQADPKMIELEITESLLLEENDRNARTLAQLRAMGFNLALDDFGTGYSSLAYLRRYPVDKIKIDRSFITNLGVEKEAEAVVGAIVNLARALDLEVIAEGVETEIQRIGLGRAGCSQIQGYIYAEPMPADAIEAYVAGFGERPAQAMVS